MTSDLVSDPTPLPRTRIGMPPSGVAPPRPTRPDGAPLSDILNDSPTWGLEYGTDNVAPVLPDAEAIHHRFLDYRARRQRLED